MGKTQIAKEFSHKSLNSYRIVWWFNSNDSLDTQYRELAVEMNRVLNGCLIEVDKLSLLAIVKEVKRTLRQIDSFLLIFDALVKTQDFKRNYLPACEGEPNKNVLITSYLDEWECSITVKPFAQVESLEYMTRELTCNKDAINIRELCKLLEGYPLAITHAIAYLNKRQNITLDLYVMYYKSSNRKLQKLQKKMLKEKKYVYHDDYDKSMQSVLKFTLKTLLIHNEIAKAMIIFCSVINGQLIREEVLVNFCNFTGFSAHEEILDAVGDLTSVFLLSIESREKRTYSIHSVVQDKVKRFFLKRDKDKQDHIEKILQFIRAYFNYDLENVATIVSSNQYLVHILKLVKHSEECKLESMSLGLIYARLGKYYGYLKHGSPIDKLNKAKVMLRSHGHQLIFLEAYAENYAHLAFFCIREGMSGKAKKYTNISLNLLAEEAQDGDKIRAIRAICCVVMGYVCQFERNYKNSKIFFKMALAISKVFNMLMGSGAAFHGIAKTYMSLRKLEHAKVAAFEACKTKTFAYGEGHPSIGSSFYLYAQILSAAREYKLAASYFFESYKVFSAALGKRHPDAIKSYQALFQLISEKEETRGILNDLQLLKMENSVCVNDKLLPRNCAVSTVKEYREEITPQDKRLQMALIIFSKSKGKSEGKNKLSEMSLAEGEEKHRALRF